MPSGSIPVSPLTAMLGLVTLVSAAPARSDLPARDPRPRKVIVATAIHPCHRFPGQEERIQEIERLIDTMAQQAPRQYPGRGLDLVVLPEEALTMGSDRPPAERAVERNGPEMARLRAKAREHRTYVIVPLTLVDDRARGLYSNAAVLLDRGGRDAGIYRKVHPVAPYDSDVLEGGIAPGREFPVFDCDFGRVGIQICWDMCYDDGWQALAGAGAEIVALPSASPQTVRPAAHALRGRYYVVSSTPRENASVFNPVGRISAQITERGVLVHQIDLSYALLHWSPTLENGRAFTKKYGDRAGYLYYTDEDTGIFWSNDPQTPITEMVRELGQVEMREHIERVGRLNEATGDPDNATGKPDDRR